MPTSRHRREALLRRQVGRLEHRISRLEAASSRYSWLRLAWVLAGIAFLVIDYYAWSGWLGVWILLAVAAGFAVIVYFHQRLGRGLARHRVWRRIKATHIARLSLDWPSIPERQLSVVGSAHPFARDLDLEGPRSLHHLIDTAVSKGGSGRLLDWLTTTAPDAPTIRERQQLVRELVPLASFRDRLELSGVLVSDRPHEAWDGERLLAWLEEHEPHKWLRPILAVTVVLALTHVAALVVGWLSPWPSYWPLAWAVYFGFYITQHRKYGDLFEEATHLQLTLDRFRAVAACLETVRLDAHPRLKTLCGPFRDPRERPSVLMRRVTRIAGAAGLHQNPILWFLVNGLVPWDLFFAHRLDVCKVELERELPGWLDVWYELEALASLANFAYLNPAAAFPEIGDSVAPATGRLPVFAADAMTHPLLDPDTKVANDFAFGRLGELVIITGSNMSGKSTFLRTLGINLSLAFAGGAVDATSMRLIPFRIFTCINVSDSVHDGISYFYAEVKRLKALLSELERRHPLPLFFLIDEIFRGTNNRERMIGTRAYVHALAGGHGIGAISTHDLELVQLADTLPGVANHHFRETVAGGRMVFDYRLRDGPCPTTNALKIMEMEGLPVAAAES